ncbi:MAG: hypothetical protein H0Z35_02590 [Thermoanaerobacteraceae bacterium]|nr:hypothetical protein [Thermoanaerobacteraceae bacterium]
MSQEMQVVWWVVGILAAIFFGGLYFWAKSPTLPKPTLFEVMDETEAEILTEVEKKAEAREKHRKSKYYD